MRAEILIKYYKILYFKDKLKVFDDFKNKQKSVWSNVVWYESVFNALYVEIKHKY